METVTMEEGKELGLNSREINGINAARAILDMIAKIKAMTPEERFESWKNDVEEDLRRIGYHSLPCMFFEGYNLAVRRSGDSGDKIELFRIDFKAYMSDCPDLSKAKLNKTLLVFNSMSEMYDHVKNYSIYLKLGQDALDC